MAVETDGIEALPKENSTHENAALVRRFYEEIFTLGHLDAADELVAADFVEHIPSPLPAQPTQGPKAVKWFASMYRTAFPDLHVSIEDLMAIDDKIVTRVTWHGTHKGQLLGTDPTDKHVDIAGIDISRVAEGKLVEHWGEIDVLGGLFQLGFLPVNL